MEFMGVRMNYGVLWVIVYWIMKNILYKDLYTDITRLIMHYYAVYDI